MPESKTYACCGEPMKKTASMYGLVLRYVCVKCNVVLCSGTTEHEAELEKRRIKKEPV